MLNQIQKELLKDVTHLHEIPQGAFAFRVDGKTTEMNSTSEIIISKKTDKKGINITVLPNTRGKSCHIPVLVSKSGVNETVYNDFFIGDNSDVLIVAGCGIHNSGKEKSSHNGIHCFHIGKHCKVRYVERHLGVGEGQEKILNPVTEIDLGDESEFIIETTQIGGVSSSLRKTFACVGKESKLVVKEKILTTENQTAKTEFAVVLKGENSKVEVVSRSVAKDNSSQDFSSMLIGKSSCYGRVECDGIIVGKAKISSTPAIKAENVNAELVHEAQIGKIAGEQLIKLMTLGLNKQEAEDLIIEGFLL